MIRKANEDVMRIHHLMTAKKYRKMTLGELMKVLDWDLHYMDYMKLPGNGLRGKAMILRRKWAAEDSCV